MRKVSIVVVLALVMSLGFYFTHQVIATSNTTLSNPIATVSLSTGDSFKVELYPEIAPNTVNNFVYLASLGFYDGTSVNRVVADYLFQAGDPIGNGKGFPGYFIRSECKYNGVKNSLKHKKGIVSMARSEKFNTEGSQFFVLLEDDPHLDGQYSAFGRVTEGLERLQELSHVETSSKDRPVEALVITSITVDTFGVAYETPETLSVKEVLAQDD